ncbi:hypothetical protein L486_02336 [Kwoniella mangroviensis CBS 10435]|uniref:Uncharacterized protein n=1 Tax=Kwoniella mangroviensis CBS 10435 TaxID=1331196 RepID=A0A1B9IW67_9TREE|nr:uncharacterized protein I203_04501 [Kwoniella mangroviensis CBS 8507]OCF59664.1 hypothetical protein L486_02336 [Kwoniella mangroviensis CBS 10435]OCF66175.1 hypothetical protein I203_04501 [Kwoniella mangroviensis CBS 8507]OCF71186.1 hypothetical protein I204_08139 [Kwoniella mangroviensis CBS 8886]
MFFRSQGSFYLLTLLLPLSVLALPAKQPRVSHTRYIVQRDAPPTSTLPSSITTANSSSSTNDDTPTDPATTTTEDSNWIGKLASLAAEAASSSANAASSNGTKTSSATSSAPTSDVTSTWNKEKNGEYGAFIVELDPFTCAYNGQDTYCNDADPETLPIYSMNTDNKTVDMTWIFSAYDSGIASNKNDTKYWNNSVPMKVVKCAIVFTPGESSDESTIQVHTQRPFVKEVDEKNLVKLDCVGDADDIEKDDGEGEENENDD